MAHARSNTARVDITRTMAGKRAMDTPTAFVTAVGGAGGPRVWITMVLIVRIETKVRWKFDGV